ncbi:MAG: DUF3343 domain-containing protein [Eubacteriales bacterium]
MLFCYITFRSITGAQLGAKLLNRAGLNHLMMRSPQSMAKNGCGYALRVRGGDFYTAVNLLQQGNAPYQKLFGDYGGAGMEEVAL